MKSRLFLEASFFQLPVLEVKSNFHIRRLSDVSGFRRSASNSRRSATITKGFPDTFPSSLNQLGTWLLRAVTTPWYEPFQPFHRILERSLNQVELKPLVVLNAEICLLCVFVNIRMRVLSSCVQILPCPCRNFRVLVKGGPE